MTLWYRVFAASDTEVRPAAILERLNGLVAVSGRFAGDEAGWFSADLSIGNSSLRLERFLATEEGLRAELAGWAAHLEACGEGPEHTRLMERMVQTRQLFTLAGPDHPPLDDVCIALCRFLAATADGVYQIDGRGFFAADGTLLVRDE